MCNVSNHAVIRKIAFKELRKSRKMNIVIILAIILTCLLFTVLTSVTGGLVNGLQNQHMRQIGADKMVVFPYTLPEEYEKIKADTKVRDAVYCIRTGKAVNNELENTVNEVDCAGSAESAKSLFSAPEAGKLPEAYDEIAVSTIVLDRLKLPHEIGVTVPMELDVGGNIIKCSFSLCGYWKGDKRATVQRCWVSRAFADKAAPAPAENIFVTKCSDSVGYWQVYIDFYTRHNINEKSSSLFNRIYGDCGITPIFAVNEAYQTEIIDSGGITCIVVFLLIIFLSGYLIIYNIFNINIFANIRNYGMLKTLGTTSKQIRKIVRIQAAVYSAAGIPIGILGGLVISRPVMRSVLKNLNNVNYNDYIIDLKLILYICIFSALFSFATVLISCQKPCRIAGKVSPIDALRYNKTVFNIKKRNKKTKKATLFSISRNNLIRNKKKVTVVVLSLSLSLILTNIMYNYIREMDIDQYVDEIVAGDFVVRNEIFEYSNFMSDEDMSYISNIDGVDEFIPVYFGLGSLYMSGDTLKRAESFCSKYGLKDEKDDLMPLKNNKIVSDIYGISPKLVEKSEIEKGKIDIEKFSEGNYAIAYFQYISSPHDSSDDYLFDIGDSIELTSPNGTSKSYKIMAIGIIDDDLDTKAHRTLDCEIMISDQEYKNLFDDRNTLCVAINADKSKYDSVKNHICSLAQVDSKNLEVISNNTYIDENDKEKEMIKVIGFILIGILSAIGILNYINSVFTGNISRKHEFAMMSAVGMTGKQLKLMLVWEGICYCAMTGVFTVISQTVLNFLFFKNIMYEINFEGYFHTILPTIVIIPVFMLLSAVLHLFAYKFICKQSVIDRLRQL